MPVGPMRMIEFVAVALFVCSSFMMGIVRLRCLFINYYSGSMPEMTGIQYFRLISELVILCVAVVVIGGGFVLRK